MQGIRFQLSFGFLSWSSCGSMQRRHRDRVVVEPTAQRPNQVDGQRELTRAQFGVEALLREQRRLSGKYFEVVADAFAVTQERQVVRFLRGSQGLALLHALLVHALERGELIHHLAQGIGEGRVVLLDGDVVVSILAGEVAAQAPGVEDWQRNRGPGAHHAARRGQEAGATQALQADERRQIDVGIKLSLRRCDIFLRGFDSPALRDQIRTAAAELRRHARGQRDSAQRLVGRTCEREPAVGTLAEERRNLVARELNRLLQLDNLLAGRGQRRLRLPQAQPRLDAGTVAVARERVDMLAIPEVRLRDVELQISALQLHVGLRDAGGQRQPRGIGLDLGGARLAHGTLISRAVLAPEVDLPIERHLQFIDRRPVAAQRRREQSALAEALASARRTAVHLKRQRCLGDIGKGERLARTCCGDLECRAAGERLVHQLIELRVIERMPPVLRRPCRGRDGRLGERLLRRELVRAVHRRLDGKPVHAGAASGKQRSEERARRPSKPQVHVRRLWVARIGLAVELFHHYSFAFSRYNCSGYGCLGNYGGKKNQAFSSILFRKSSSWRASALVKPRRRPLMTSIAEARILGYSALPSSVSWSFTVRRSSATRTRFNSPRCSRRSIILVIAPAS